MGRGGKRPGAGRKTSLDEETVATIRRDCEQRANVLRQEQAVQRHKTKMIKRGVTRGEDGDTDPVRLVPLEDRAAVDRYGVKDPTNRHLPERLSDEAKSAIEIIRHNQKWFGVYSEPLPRLARGRSRIIADVARDWGVSERTVRTIWESDSDV